MSYPRRALLVRPRVLSLGCLLLGLGVAVGCGEPDRPPPNSSGTGGESNDGNGDGGSESDGSGGDGGSGADGTGGEPAEPGAPNVEVLSPEEDSVLTDTLSVVCGVTSDDAAGSEPVNPESVSVRLSGEDGLAGESPAVAGAADQYTAELSIADVPPGLYTVQCSASDTSSPPLQASAEVDVLVDHGPTIEAISPLSGSFFARAGLHDFEVKITPEPLFEGDDDADIVGDPILSVDHHEFALAPKDGAPDVYIVEGVDFEDTDLFAEPPPDQTAIRVTAENGRGILGELEYTLAIDGTGPEITIVAPIQATIIGSRVTFVLQITDDFSGVDWDSLVVEPQDIPIPYDAASSRWTQSGDTATLELTTADYSAATQLSINVTVSDLAGNLSSNGAGSTYFLDQQPPLLSLDPPNMRLRREPAPDAYECSHSFDPVGPLAANDGDATYNLVLFRALAWDETNEEQGQLIKYHSGVDPSSLRLWLAQAGEPLVVDASDDGVDRCDAVSAALDADLDAVSMTALASAGTPFFGALDAEDEATPPDMTSWCNYPASPALTPPEGLCADDSDLSVAVAQFTGGVSSVYAPLVGAGPACTGNQQSIEALLGAYEGWVCAAVTGQDSAGNTTVSAPIAICVDSPDLPTQPTCLPGAAPDCTDNCQPATFDPDGMIIGD